jgi:hypothetical protein
LFEQFHDVLSSPNGICSKRLLVLKTKNRILFLFSLSRRCNFRGSLQEEQTAGKPDAFKKHEFTSCSNTYVLSKAEADVKDLRRTSVCLDWQMAADEGLIT